MVVAVDHFGRCQLCTLVHPHIERSIVPERKAPLLRIEVVRRHPQIGQNAIDPLHTQIAQPGVHETEIAFDKSQPGIIGKIGPRITILIECEQTALRSQPL